MFKTKDNNINISKNKSWFHHWWFWLIILIIFWFGVPILFNWLWPGQIMGTGFTVRPGQSEVKNQGLVQVETTDDPSLGPADAPVVIVEFSDFECPYCRAAAPIIRAVVKNNYEAVRLIYRDYPVVEIHPQSIPAAQAANCAAEQKKFWEYHDLLFVNQEKLGEPLYNELAVKLKLDMVTFASCLNNKSVLMEMKDDLEAGFKAGVRGTPTWFVNGRKIEGVISKNDWQKIIQAAIKEKFSKSNSGE